MSSPFTMAQPWPGVAPMQINAWAANPLVDGVEAARPDLFKIASAEGPAPTMFESGDLPPFTASGVDPATLSMLPYGLRHAAATMPDRSAVYGLLSQAKDPDATEECDGLTAYKRRVFDWLTGKGVPAQPRKLTPEAQDNHDQALDEMYAQTFGAAEQHQADTTAAARARVADLTAQRSRTGKYDPMLPQDAA